MSKIKVNKKRNVELLIIDKKLDISYQGYCKLTINKPSKHLLIEPYNEDFKLVLASFNQIYVQINNVLCIFAKDYNNDAILVFRKPEACQKVYDIVLQNKTDSTDDFIDPTSNLVKQRFLIPLLKNFKHTNDKNIKDCILKLKTLFKGDQEYMQILNDADFDTRLFLDLSDGETALQELKENDSSKVQLKSSEPASESSKPAKDLTYMIPYDEGKIILESDKFELKETINTIGCKSFRIFIYASEDKMLCYEFSEAKCKGENKFVCLGCHALSTTTKKNKESSHIKLKLCQHSNGEYYVRMKDDNHLCQPREYAPEIYAIIKYPDFNFFTEKTSSLKLKLMVKNVTDKNLCYIYYYKNVGQTFYCIDCRKLKQHPSAKIYNKEDGTEYIRLGPKKHLCTGINYSQFLKKKINILKNSGIEIVKKKLKKEDEKKFVKHGDFEFRSNVFGDFDRIVVIYFPENKNLCYKLHYNVHSKLYECLKCKLAKKLTVTARLFTDDNGQKYLRYGKNDHQCELQEYQKVIYPPDYMIINPNATDTSKKLIIFTSFEQKMCYQLSYVPASHMFICHPCRSYNTHVIAKHFKCENGKEYVELGKMNHACTPKLFDINIYQKEAPREMKTTTNFLLQYDTLGNFGKLFLFNSSDKKTGYEFHIKDTTYYCLGCKTKGKTWSLKLLSNENEEEYVKYKDEPHACTMKNFFELGRIIYSQNFQIQRAANGGLQSITVMDAKKKGLRCIFEYDTKAKAYFCNGCKIRERYISATICKNENDEEYLIINSAHTCGGCIE